MVATRVARRPLPNRLLGGGSRDRAAPHARKGLGNHRENSAFRVDARLVRDARWDSGEQLKALLYPPHSPDVERTRGDGIHNLGTKGEVQPVRRRDDYALLAG